MALKGPWPQYVVLKGLLAPCDNMFPRKGPRPQDVSIQGALAHVCFPSRAQGPKILHIRRSRWVPMYIHVYICVYLYILLTMYLYTQTHIYMCEIKCRQFGVYNEAIKESLKCTICNSNPYGEPHRNHTYGAKYMTFFTRDQILGDK